MRPEPLEDFAGRSAGREGREKNKSETILSENCFTSFEVPSSWPSFALFIVKAAYYHSHGIDVIFLAFDAIRLLEMAGV